MYDPTDPRQSSIPALRLGMATQDYVARRLAGEKWCHECQGWKAVAGFPPDQTNPDGLATMCRDCKRIYDRERYRRITGCKPRVFRPKGATPPKRQKPRPRPQPAPPPLPQPVVATPASDDLARARARIAARRTRQAQEATG